MPRRTSQNYANKELLYGSGSAKARMKRPKFDLIIPPQPGNPRLAEKAPPILHFMQFRGGELQIISLIIGALT